MNRHRRLLLEMWSTFRHGWRELFVADISYKVVAGILLLPVVSVMFRGLLWISGRTVLADADILSFLLGPAGWICLISVGGMSLAILALEQSALLKTLAEKSRHDRVSILAMMGYSLSNSQRVLTLTLRMVAFGLLAAVPFLALAGVTYVQLLTDHDINFYLTHKPPAFLTALVIGAVLAVGLASVALRLASSWLFSLPMVLFEGTPPSTALKLSSQRTHGHRRVLVGWLAAWFLTNTVVSSLASSVVLFFGHSIVSQSADSLRLLILVVGIIVLAMGVINVISTLLGTTTFAVMLMHLYRNFGEGLEHAVVTTPPHHAAAPRATLRLTPFRITVGALAALAGAVAISLTMLNDIDIDENAQITAHRGASGAAPENTLAAVKKAIEDRADWVEIDVQETADDRVVVFHDSDFKKLANNPLKIWDATAADLQTIDIGGWFSKEFSDQRVPTLAEVLQECKGKVKLNIELKYYGHDIDLERRVIELVESHGMQSDIVVMSLNGGAVVKMKTLRPDWTVGLLTAVKVGDLTSAEADFLAVKDTLATRSFIRSAHRSGKQVYAWTLNDVLTISAAIGRGVDNIITDEPALARRVLVERSKLNTSQRLLLELAAAMGVTPELPDQ